MLFIQTLTINQLAEKLREMGVNISNAKVQACIDQGIFKDFAHRVDMKSNEYLIFEKDFETWVKARAIER